MRTGTDPVTGTQARAAPLGAEERSDEASRGEVGQERPAPDPEVVAKPMRRQFTEYRLRIVEEADRCTQPAPTNTKEKAKGLGGRDWKPPASWSVGAHTPERQLRPEYLPQILVRAARQNCCNGRGSATLQGSGQSPGCSNLQRGTAAEPLELCAWTTSGSPP